MKKTKPQGYSPKQGPTTTAALSIGEIIRLPSGKIQLRPKPGQSLCLTSLAKIDALPTGAYQIEAVEDWIKMDRAMQILDLPYTTLRRVIEMGAVVAKKRSPKRWLVSLESAMELKRKLLEDPQFWEKFSRKDSRY